jgi:carbonic anhydrase
MKHCLAALVLVAATDPAEISFALHGSDWTEGVCSSRAAQSPVDFEALKLPPMKELVYDYPPVTTNFSITNAGHAIEVKTADLGKGGVLLDNVRYNLVAVDFHASAEHTVRGKRNPLEVQMSHKASGHARMVILSYLVDCKTPPTGVGEPANFTSAPAATDVDFNPALQPFLAAALPEKGQSMESSETLDIMKFLTATPDGPATFWQYDGSQTVPPCSESARWFVRRETLLASDAQIDMLDAALRKMSGGDGNYRVSMPWNERKPTIYRSRQGSLEPEEATDPTRLRSGPFPRTDGELQAVKQAELAAELAGKAVEYADDFEKRVTDAADTHLESLQAQRKRAEEAAMKQADLKREVAAKLKEPVPAPVAKHFMPLVRGLADEAAKKVVEGVKKVADDAAEAATKSVRVEAARQQYAASVATLSPAEQALTTFAPDTF